MDRFEAAVETANTPALRALDVSMFTLADITNVALQRPEVLQDIDGHAAALSAWDKGDARPLTRIADRYRLELVLRALGFVMLEYHALRGLLQDLRPARIADIGCGYGFFSYFAHAEFQSDIILIDIESQPLKPRLFQRRTACTDLQVAYRFLVANGAVPDSLTMINPTRQDLGPVTDVDLAVSFLACGYAFPVEPYLDLLRSGVVPGGDILIDIQSARAPRIAEDLSVIGTQLPLGPAADGKAVRLHVRTHSRSRHAAA